jgi:hypothetical protein
MEEAGTPAYKVRAKYRRLGPRSHEVLFLQKVTKAVSDRPGETSYNRISNTVNKSHRQTFAPGSGGEPLCKTAVLQDGNKRLPRMTQRWAGLSVPSEPHRKTNGPGCEHNPGPFPGAACSHLIELPSGEAAPLQVCVRPHRRER